MSTKKTLNLTLSVKNTKPIDLSSSINDDYENSENEDDNENYDDNDNDNDNDNDDNVSEISSVISPISTTTSSIVKNDIVDIKSNRDKIREKFISILNDEKGNKCENLLYEYIKKILKTSDANDIHFRKEYLAIAYNLIENLNINGYVNNTYLHPKVMDGTISLEKLVSMTDEELYPPKWQALRDKRLKEIKNENNLKVATTDLYKCNRCHKRECTYYQLQTRSQDEPMTTFITCNNCNARWKE